MGLYEDNLAAAARTPQDLLVVGVRQCANLYATQIEQLLQHTDELDLSPWVDGSSIPVAPDQPGLSPDGKEATADRLSYTFADEYFEQQTGSLQTAKPYTFSVWLRGAGTITLRIKDGSGLGGSGSEVQVTMASTWTKRSEEH